MSEMIRYHREQIRSGLGEAPMTSPRRERGSSEADDTDDTQPGELRL